ncbi:MAG TPA: IS4 family transposase [Oligoflexus sp.]|uniref:IS4 family transposase n=1 Tax=Oligoflexus sp. TaxID=1971216 RepID=UPI002D5ABBFD|nr:IS4 family transposase [Oligoflexus sp.]HYX32309.1 IS4 family transposase [Oligoflexus sp.]
MSNEHDYVSWIDSDFSTLDFGDHRLTKRFFLTAKRLMASPDSSLNQAMNSKAELKAAYRFFRNEKVDADEVLSSHQVGLMGRIQNEKVILAIQDSSLLVYSGHKKTQGLGEMGRVYTSGDRGIWLHSCLAVSSAGLPLGIFSHHCWARDRPFEKSDCRVTRRNKRQLLTADEKESIKWVDSLEQTMAIANGSGAKIITIADREADYNVLMGRAIELGDGFIIRSRTDRLIHDYFKRSTTLYSKLDSSAAKGTIKAVISKHDDKSNVPVTLKIKFFPFSCRISPNLKKYARVSQISSMRLWAVEAEEVKSVSGDRLHWILLTTEPVHTVEDAKKIIDWYRAHWMIETYFKVLKSGLRIEECRLGSADRLFRYVALMAIIGYRILYLSRISRASPAMSCTAAFTESEWKVLAISTKRMEKIPTDPPSIYEAVIMLARLGGYQSRKTDPPPGPIVIWRGLKALKERVQVYEILSH